MQLRDYQQEAIDACYNYLRNNKDNPCIVAPTGAGKSLIIASICKDAVIKWKSRVLVLSHVKELLQQNADKLHRLAPEVDFGIYSAGLKSRDTKEPVIIAGIQSVYERACELGRFDLVIIDESHLIPPSGDGRYQTFLKTAKLVNPKIRVIGLTATPYRMTTGLLCGPENILNNICYDIGIKRLIKEGYLCPIFTKVPEHEIDTSRLHIKHGEFDSKEVSELFEDDLNVYDICRDVIKRAVGRHSILIFCARVEQAKKVIKELQKQTGEEAALITGDTPAKERAEIIARFRNESTGLIQEVEPLRWLVNVNVLTTGFDAPNIDCIVLARPTASPGLYAQMVGRSLRICDGKTDGLILDYGENIKRHGPIDAINVKARNNNNGPAPVKTCPKCQLVLHAAVSTCPECKHEFPRDERTGKLIDPNASEDGILSGQETEDEYDVVSIHYQDYRNKNWQDGNPVTLKITYEIGINNYESQWVCPEHDGYAGEKFVEWWNKRSKITPPFSSEQTAKILNSGITAAPKKIIIKRVAGEFFPKITELDFTEIPDTTEFNLKTCVDCIHNFQGECQLGNHAGEFINDMQTCEHYNNDFTPIDLTLEEVPF